MKPYNMFFLSLNANMSVKSKDISKAQLSNYICSTNVLVKKKYLQSIDYYALLLESILPNGITICCYHLQLLMLAGVHIL